MSARRFSQRAWDQRFQAAVARAFATVPYYREMWAEAGAPLEEPVVTPVARLDAVLDRLYPLARPYERQREEPGWTGEPGELMEALKLTGDYRGEPLFEVRRALLDWERIGRARYHVVLGADAEVADPELRAAGVRAFHAAREPALLGDPAQIAALPAHPGRARVFLRRSLTDLGTRDSRHGEVVHDPRLGYLGGRYRTCGHVHLNWRRVHARQSPSGPLLTLLRRRRPTLAGISVPGTAHLGVQHCPEHGTPILREVAS
ncbi:hypothetical protein ACTMTI_10225 [Nonomuraea sp. H19]|uniref:hypothetical protein n=1 Tax=Nonomuraea sp. H19 TaxID=3452206 RepID=UPI003F8B5818